MLIDVVRGIAITLVVLGHTNQGLLHRGWWGASPVGMRLNNCIYAVHMPAFFFVSGIFLLGSINKRGERKFIFEKLRTLIYPYLLWAVITWVALVPLARFTVLPRPNFTAFLLSVLTASYSWFLPTLFFTMMIAIFLRLIPMPLGFLIAAALSLWWPSTGITFVDLGFLHLPFLVAGMWVGRSFNRIESISSPVCLISAGVLCAVIIAVVLGYGRGGLLFLPLGALGTLMLMLFAKLLGRSAAARLLAWLGEASIGIFLLSSYLQGAGRQLVLMWHHTTAPLPQLVVPTLLATFIPAWLYQRRDSLHLRWFFVAPF